METPREGDIVITMEGRQMVVTGWTKGGRVKLGVGKGSRSVPTGDLELIDHDDGLWAESPREE